MTRCVASWRRLWLANLLAMRCTLVAWKACHPAVMRATSQALGDEVPQLSPPWGGTSTRRRKGAGGAAAFGVALVGLEVGHALEGGAVAGVRDVYNFLPASPRSEGWSPQRQQTRRRAPSRSAAAARTRHQADGRRTPGAQRARGAAPPQAEETASVPKAPPDKGTRPMPLPPTKFAGAPGCRLSSCWA